MTKKEDLVKKKKKRESDKIAAKSKYRIVIDVDDQDDIRVEGAIGPFPLFMKIMCRAIDVANDHNLKLSNQVAAQAEKEKAGKSLVIQ